MAHYYCPRCGSEANLLLNLVSCLTNSCPNYDINWVHEWNSKNVQHYQHSTYLGINHRFLGCYSVNPGRSNSQVFDLYCYQIPNSYYICLARCGDADSDCYYTDDQETEIGSIEAGPLKSAPANALAALKEAVRRFKKKV